MTALGTDAPNAIGIVYVAAFALIDDEGFAWLSEDDFVGHFAADVDPARARVMHAVQQPLHTDALGQEMGAPAWKSLPTWYLVAENDEAIPPDAERQFAQRMGATTVEVASSHVPMVSQPDAVVELIETAAAAVPAAAT
jgi:pimeloyl-ACP methyl ester carboxylesterase